jgi:hypothetical protein
LPPNGEAYFPLYTIPLWHLLEDGYLWWPLGRAVPTPTARFPRRCASTSVTLGPGVEPPKLFRRGVGVLLVDVAAVARLVRPHAFESDSRVFASEGHAFEERLRQQSLSGGAPLAWLRKMVAFDRFLARVAQKQPGPWIVKGGFIESRTHSN